MKQQVDLSGSAFSDVDRSGCAKNFINYLDHATDHFGPLKTFSHSLLQLSPGRRVLDVGCGCGDDLRKLAKLVAPNGQAIGIDNSQSLVKEARRRTVGCELQMRLAVGLAEHLPLHSNYFDACRADRVFQHLTNPENALHEMLRVLKRGGRIVVIDRDWNLVAMDADDVETTRAVLNRACSGIRNGRMGRELYGLFTQAGVLNAEVYPQNISINSFAVADTLLDLRVVLARAIAENLIGRHVGAKWLSDLLDRDAAHKFSATLAIFVASGAKE